MTQYFLRLWIFNDNLRVEVFLVFHDNVGLATDGFIQFATIRDAFDEVRSHGCSFLLEISRNKFSHKLAHGDLLPGLVPLFQKWRKQELVELHHEPKASSLVEKVELLVVLLVPLLVDESRLLAPLLLLEEYLLPKQIFS